MKIIAFSNAKGGVGKTTSTCNVGLEMASRGHRILLVDMDPQADTSRSFGVQVSNNTVGQLLLNKAKIKDCILPVSWLNDEHQQEPVKNLWLLPSSLQLSSQEAEVHDKKDFQFLLHKKLVTVADDFDYVLIDCPPALGPLTYMAFCAADAYVIPSSAEQLSFNKIEVVRKVAEGIRTSGENERLKLIGIVFTKHNANAQRILNKAILLAATAQHGRENILPSIRQDTLLAEAQAEAIPIMNYVKKSNGADDYVKLTTAILNRI